MGIYLSQDQINNFHRDGFLIIPNYLDDDEIATLRLKAEKMVNDFDVSQVSVFSTVDQTKTSDQYFIDSGDKIRCFFEEESFDQDGQLIQDKMYAINKIGHALHDLDDDFHKASYKKELAGIARDIGMKNPLMVQSQYIFKQPKIGGKVVAHQDNTFIYTDPPSCMGFWMALEDATVENGCLQGIPGSHGDGDVQRRFLRNQQGDGVLFQGESREWDLSRMVPLEAKNRSLVLLDGACVHMSAENRSPHSRHAYIIHAVDATNDQWPVDNWLQRPPEMPFKHLNEEVGFK
ncbi:MAG: phytanoyl-CoA dioxygenase family protein [Bacteroidetes bacterium]|nr:phytanoyl-CoA dioxygenase family protein [Bacteroidota bacterium]